MAGWDLELYLVFPTKPFEGADVYIKIFLMQMTGK